MRILCHSIPFLLLTAVCMTACNTAVEPGDAAVAEAATPAVMATADAGPSEAEDVPVEKGASDMPCTSVTFDGHTYAAVAVGNRCWFAENLASTHFASGEEIPYGRTDGEWLAGANRPLYCAYSHSDAMAERYGLLYSGYAVEDDRALCPSGWHVATDGDWQDLEVALGASPATVGEPGNRDTQALKLAALVKSKDGWPPASAGTDDFGLAMSPAGTRLSDARFMSAGSGATIWTSTEDIEAEEPKLFFRGLGNQNPGIFKSSFSKLGGFSVRCVRD